MPAQLSQLSQLSQHPSSLRHHHRQPISLPRIHPPQSYLTDGQRAQQQTPSFYRPCIPSNGEPRSPQDQDEDEDEDEAELNGPQPPVANRSAGATSTTSARHLQTHHPLGPLHYSRTCSGPNTV